MINKNSFCNRMTYQAVLFFLTETSLSETAYYIENNLPAVSKGKSVPESQWKHLEDHIQVTLLNCLHQMIDESYDNDLLTTVVHTAVDQIDLRSVAEFMVSLYKLGNGIEN